MNLARTAATVRRARDASLRHSGGGIPTRTYAPPSKRASSTVPSGSSRNLTTWATTCHDCRWKFVRLRVGTGRGAAGWPRAAIVVERGRSRTSLRSGSLSVLRRATAPRQRAGKAASPRRGEAEAAAETRTAANATHASAARGAGRSLGMRRGYPSGEAAVKRRSLTPRAAGAAADRGRESSAVPESLAAPRPAPRERHSSGSPRPGPAVRSRSDFASPARSRR